MCLRRPLPAVDEATARYEADPTDEHLARVAVASAPWNFAPETVEIGAELLARMPYNGAAVKWSDDNFDTIYAATWWPTTVPTLIVSGGDDGIVAQTAWEATRFSGANVVRRIIPGGAHFPWIERPAAVATAFSEFAVRAGA